MDQHLIAYYIGIFIVFASHIYIIYKPADLHTSPETHAYINLVAALLIAYYFTSKEDFIHF